MQNRFVCHVQIVDRVASATPFILFGQWAVCM